MESLERFEENIVFGDPVRICSNGYSQSIYNKESGMFMGYLDSYDNGFLNPIKEIYVTFVNEKYRHHFSEFKTHESECVELDEIRVTTIEDFYNIIKIIIELKQIESKLLASKNGIYYSVTKFNVDREGVEDIVPDRMYYIFGEDIRDQVFGDENQAYLYYTKLLNEHELEKRV